MRNSTIKTSVASLLPFLVGIACFFLVIGPRALNPWNIAWLEHGDPAQHYLGWLFFRNSPWTFPVIGSNPEFGLTLSNSIVFSDSNPLFAFVFKPFSALLPEAFQYFGIWLLLCCVLQAFFAWKLVGIYTTEKFVKTLSSVLFVFSPAMLARLDPGHLSLIGHFLILAALYLVLRPGNHKITIPWLLLVSMAALIHGYILAIVLVIWGSNLFDRAFQGTVTKGALILQFIVVTGGLLGTMWIAGYFTVGKGAAASGFGAWHLNLVAPFNPAGWSYFLPEIPAKEGYYSDNNFLGLGIIFLLLCAGVHAKENIQRLYQIIRMHPAFFLAQIAMVIFAISNQIGIGPWLLTYDLPEPLLKIANVFRVSNRMFWPTYYLLFLAAITGVINFRQQHIIWVVFVLAATLQVIDTRPGWSAMRQKLMVNPSNEWQSDLADPFWSEVASHYQKIRWIRPVNEGPHWKSISHLAGVHKIGTDAVYLARVSDKALEETQEDSTLTLATGNYAADTLYILDDGVVAKALHSLGAFDLLARVNNLNVLAPNWKRCTTCVQHPPGIDITALRKPLKSGERIYFDYSNKGGSLYLLEGWHPPEWLGTWSDGQTAKIVVPIAENTIARELQFEVYPLLNGKKTEQSITIVINGLVHTTQNLNAQSNKPIIFSVNPSLSQVKELMIEFITPDASSPQALGINKDARTLGIKLRSVGVM